jgi:hypothetical protein
MFKLHQKQSNDGLQLRRAISMQLKEQGYLRKMLSRRQLQGFVGLRRILKSLWL